MKELYSKILLLLIDTLAIALSILLGYKMRIFFGGSFTVAFEDPLSLYLFFPLMYVTTIFTLNYEGIYTKRYDFWHECRQIIKALALSFVLILAFLAMTKSINEYSRATIVFIFANMIIIIPLSKLVIKTLLYHAKLWQREASVYNNEPFITKEIFDNHYLGYVMSKNPKTIFINSKGADVKNLHQVIDKEIQKVDEVIFVPLVNEYDLTQSTIYQLSNTRTNLIVFKNRLNSKYRLWTKKISDLSMSIIIFPMLTPILVYIAYKIRKEEPKSSIIFKQERLGIDGNVFVCYKFRTMLENSNDRLQAYLKKHPEEVEFYKIYHKYQNDPRVTNIGNILRKTSLDELPQIFNVLKNEMSFIGPRPYMLNEKDKIGNDVNSVLTVRPGITGLWQVSGRSNIDFKSRVKLDTWYVKNWNLWMDLVILLKTIKTVLVRKGAS